MLDSPNSFNSSGDKTNYNGQLSPRQKKRQENIGSKHLTEAENQHLFMLLGSKRVLLKAANVQLVRANNGSWQKMHVGVVSLVKDYKRKLYMLMIFDIKNEQELWEQVLHKSFNVQFYSDCLLSFESNGYICGLEFQDEQEAFELKKLIDEQVQIEKERNQSYCESKPNASISTLRNDHSFNTFQTPTVKKSALHRFMSYLSSKKKKFVAKEEKKIDQSKDFSQTTHLDGDKQHIETPMNESTRKVFKLAGLNPDSLTYDDLAFARQFIDNHQNRMKLIAQSQTPLARNSSQAVKINHGKSSILFNNSAPKSVGNDDANTVSETPVKKMQSPVEHNQLKVSPNSLSNQNKSFEQSSSPSKQQSFSASPIAKSIPNNNNARLVPKAPPMPIAASTPIDTRANLLSQIQTGVKLRSVEKPHEKSGFSIGRKIETTSSSNLAKASVPKCITTTAQMTPTPFVSSVSNDQSTDLLSQIRTGIKLRSVGQSSQKSELGKSTVVERDESCETIDTPKRFTLDSSKKATSNIFNTNGLTGALLRAMEERRKEVCEDEKYDSSDESMNGEWDN